MAAVLVMTGCTGTASGPSTSGASKTLKVWNYYAAGPGLTWLQDETKKFEKANPGVNVQLVQVPFGQMDQKLLASSSTGTGPDVLVNNVVVDYPTLASAGVMKDMTSDWNSYPDKSEFPSSAVWTTKGKVFNVMSYTNLVGLYYNKTILSQYGITTPPKTLDEMQADMAKVVAGGKYGGLAESGAPTSEGAWLFAPQLLGQNIDYCNFKGPKVTAAFDRVATWSKDGYIPLATATWAQSDAWQQFMTGKFAFGLNGNWNLGGAKDATFKYGTTTFPEPSGGKSVVYPGGEGLAVGSHSTDPALAWKYIEDVFLSKSASEANYAASGSIPVRADVGSTAALKDNKLVQPFVQAAAATGKWPNNVKTAQLQSTLGTAISAVISGQQSGAQGAQSAITGIATELKAGGGGC
jgi:multiple sugar transport system substrate-binding protein